MKTKENIIEAYLRSEFNLGDNQLRYELERFERNPDIGEELSEALRTKRFPKERAISVSVGGKFYTAEMLYQSLHAKTIYASYSLLTQLREHPELVSQLTAGFKIK